MTPLCAFLVAGRTRNGCPFVAAAIGDRGSRREASRIASGLGRFSLPASCDPCALDRALARALKELCSRRIYAAGVSIRVADSAGPAGGVLGNPRLKSSSANGGGEEIGHGLSVAAWAGGPGIVLKGSPAAARNALSVATPGAGGWKTLRQMMRVARSSGAEVAIAVADGTGCGQTGGAAGLENGRISFLSLRRGRL